MPTIEPRPLVYVAGPYSYPDPITNVRRAALAGMELYRSTGVAVIIPHTSALIDLVYPMPVEDWYRFDLHQLERCDALYRLDGPSSGADDEVEHAHGLGIPVFYESGNLARGLDALRRWADQWGKGAAA